MLCTDGPGAVAVAVLQRVAARGLTLASPVLIAPASGALSLRGSILALLNVLGRAQEAQGSQEIALNKT
jgi:hypothetical protein